MQGSGAVLAATGILLAACASQTGPPLEYRPHVAPPVVIPAAAVGAATRRALAAAVAELNAALGPDLQLGYAENSTGRNSGLGAIAVQVLPPEAIAAPRRCGRPAAGCTALVPLSKGTAAAVVWLAEPGNGRAPRRGVILHELLHALGVWGHTADGVLSPTAAADVLEPHEAARIRAWIRGQAPDQGPQ